MARVAVIVGSLRKASFNKKVADALEKLAPAGLAFDRLEIGDLPLFNEDLETETPPAAWTRFREEVLRADALLFVTPEYNRSVPAVLKNAVDVGSRPWGKSVWNAKPAAVISASPGAIGGFGANQHLRQSLSDLNAPVMPAPVAYLSHIHQAFDEQGALNSDAVRGILSGFLAAFAVWIARNSSG